MLLLEKATLTNMALYLPFIKRFKINIPHSELPSTGIFYPSNVKIEIDRNVDLKHVHTLMYTYKIQYKDALHRVKILLEALKPIIIVKNMQHNNIVLCDLYYIYIKTCNVFFDLGYWHHETKSWKRLKDKQLQFSRKLLTKPYDPKNKTFKIDEWNVSEPSVKNMLLAYDYIIWKAKNGKTTSEKEAKMAALITYTCGQNNMNFSSFDAVLESFSHIGEDKLLKTVSKLDEYGIKITGILDGVLIDTKKLEPLPKIFN